MGASSLSVALGNQRQEIREAALRALCSLGESAAPELSVALSNDFVEVRVKAAAALGRLFCSAEQRIQIACKAMVKDLVHPDAPVRVAALKAIGLSGEAAKAYIDDVARLLRDNSAEVRCAAAAALGSLGSAAERYFDAACAVAVECLTHSQLSERNAAAVAIGHLGEAGARYAPLACGKVVVHLHDEIDTHREASAVALCALPHVAVEHMRALVGLLDDDSPHVHCAATRALMALGPPAHRYLPSAREVVAYLLGSPDATIRNKAVEVLGDLSQFDNTHVSTQLACQVAAEGLLSDSEIERVAAAEALAAFGTIAVAYWKAMADLSMSALQSEDPHVRITASRVLSRLGKGVTSRVSEACRVAAIELKSSDWTVRAQAAHALYTSGTAAGLRADELMEALRDSKAVVRHRAANALGSLGAFGAGHLAIALKDTDWKQRVAAGKTFEKWPPSTMLSDGPRSVSPYFFDADDPFQCAQRTS